MSSRSSPPAARRAVWVGVVVATLAVSPPLHELAHGSVTAHMVQHLLLVVVAAPLIGIALAAQAPRWRRRAVRRIVGAAVRSRAAPFIAGGAHIAVLVMWHHPVLYDAAVAGQLVHALEHGSLLATGAWWWSTLHWQTLGRAPLGAVVSTFAAGFTCAALGVLMMFAPLQLYAQGGTEDQRVAGALMAGGAGAVYVAASAVAVWCALRTAAARRRAHERVARARVAAVDAARAGSKVFLAAALVTATAFALGLRSADANALAGALPRGGQDGGDLVDLGRELYRRDCVSCHGVAGEGSFRGIPIHDRGTASVFYALSTGRMPIDDPDDSIRRREPPYEPHEIAAIVSYADTFVDGPARATIDRGTADLARGGVQYRLHCAACHSATGIGGAQALGREAPSVLQATADEVAAAIAAGPGGMPAFGATFSDEDVASVAAYVEYLQDPTTTGIPLAGGRVGEGLVAWLAGIGIVLAAVARIGRRA